MFKGLRRSPGQKDPGEKGSPPEHSKDHHHGDPSQNDYGMLLDKPWRKLEWDKRKPMKDELRNLKPSNSDVAKLRILVHGPVGAGKSALINSIDSIFQERMTSITITEPTSSSDYCTKTFQTHYIKDQSYTSFLPFAFCDTMGVDSGHSKGVETEDLVKVLEGHIKDGYTFNPTWPCPETDPSYNSSPKLSDRIHCLVSVIPATRISTMEDDVLSKMKAVRAKSGGIPQVTVLTKVDETCPKVADDIKHVYMSKKIKEKMQECSNRLGVPMNCIFPVKCYHEEIQVKNDVDVLLLSALTTILNFANDHVVMLADQRHADQQQAAPAAMELRHSKRHMVNFSGRSCMGDMAPPPANVGVSSKHYVNTYSHPKGPPVPPLAPVPR